jgi:hypothetical protein
VKIENLRTALEARINQSDTHKLRCTRTVLELQVTLGASDWLLSSRELKNPMQQIKTGHDNNQSYQPILSLARRHLHPTSTAAS